MMLITKLRVQLPDFGAGETVTLSSKTGKLETCRAATNANLIAFESIFEMSFPGIAAQERNEGSVRAF